MGIAKQSFPWPGRQANTTLSIRPRRRREQTTRYEADTKEMKGLHYRKDRMDANCFHVDQIVNIGILREQVARRGNDPKKRGIEMGVFGRLLPDPGTAANSPSTHS